MDLISYIITLLVFVWVAQFFIQLNILRTNSKDISEEISKVALLKLEEYDGEYFLYSIEKNEFICQGSTIAILANRTMEWKNITTAVIMISKTRGFIVHNGCIVNDGVLAKKMGINQ